MLWIHASPTNFNFLFLFLAAVFLPAPAHSYTNIYFCVTVLFISSYFTSSYSQFTLVNNNILPIWRFIHQLIWRFIHQLIWRDEIYSYHKPVLGSMKLIFLLTFDSNMCSVKSHALHFILNCHASLLESELRNIIEEKNCFKLSTTKFVSIIS